MHLHSSHNLVSWYHIPHLYMYTYIYVYRLVYVYTCIHLHKSAYIHAMHSVHFKSQRAYTHASYPIIYLFSILGSLRFLLGVWSCRGAHRSVLHPREWGEKKEEEFISSTRGGWSWKWREHGVWRFLFFFLLFWKMRKTAGPFFGVCFCVSAPSLAFVFGFCVWWTPSWFHVFHKYVQLCLFIYHPYYP